MVVDIKVDEKKVIIDDGGMYLPLPNFGGLADRLAKPFSVLNQSEQIIYYPTTEQRKALEEIEDTTCSTLKEMIVEKFP